MVKQRVYKTTLDNGLTVLLLPEHRIPKVSLQLWYNVGSKDEKSGEKGLAHFIEHMIFKGTDCLSESDINTMVHKLSGVCNAFTSYDYTGYLFDMPTQHWQEVLPIMADCMRNCTFKEDLLNSELKAVIQELKMYNDDYGSTLVEHIIGAVFPDHPYHHPIIGYKQDLWSLNREALFKFYNHHYVPNNAVLVVVGDIELESGIVAIEKNFSTIPADPQYRKERYYHTADIEARSITLYRDIQQPMVMVCWEVPGLQAGLDYVFDLMSWVIGSGKGSRLYTKIVDDLGLAVELESFVYDLFEHGLFVIHFQPKNPADIQKIIDIINEEILKFGEEQISDQELMRAVKKTEIDFLSLRENNQKMAYLLGKFFLATGDENYILNYCEPRKNLKGTIQDLIKKHLRPSVMQRGQVLPLPETEKTFWLEQQHKSDVEDARILDKIVRETHVEDAVNSHKVKVLPPTNFVFPKPEIFTLSNGLKVFAHHTADIPKIEIIIDLKAKHYYDPENLQGLSMFMVDMMQEGTENYTGQELAQELEQRGMELSIVPGQVGLTMLSSDAKKGLELLVEVLTKSTFEPEAVEHVRTQALAELKNFWDTPTQFIGQLAREKVYKDHPYAKNILGSEKTIRAITREDLLSAYKKYITPKESKFAIVGDLSNINIKELLEQTLGSKWSGPEVPSIEFPTLKPAKRELIKYPINRDQTVLCFAGLSVARKDKDFDGLLLFDQVFTGGVLGSMSSRLFELRERSGIFYTIGGSLLAGVHEQPGMIFIKTIVSNDKLAEAIKQIEGVIAEGAKNLKPEEHQEAQQAIINSLVDNFAANKQIAATFLFLDAYGLPVNYFDTRAQSLLKVTREEVKQAVQRHLSVDNLVTVCVGRV